MQLSVVTPEGSFYDGDIVALIQQQISGSVGQEWALVDYEVTSGKTRNPHVRLTLRHPKYLKFV